MVRDGKVVSRRSLLAAEEGQSREVPGRARFQITPEGRLFVFGYVSGANAQGERVSENRLIELFADGGASGWVKAPLKRPLSDFFTATVRAGSPPSRTLDLLGPPAGGGRAICYARIRLW